jgi:phosphate transport system substrate-binding protein
MDKRILILLIALALYPPLGEVRGETLVIPGTGSCENHLNYLAAMFIQKNPGNEVIIPPSIGPKSGINSVISDKSMMARVDRPLREDETRHGIQYLAFARDAVVFAVGGKVNIQNLTSFQIIDIFSGKIDNWEKVGGNQAPIRLLVREPGDTALRIVKEHMKPFREITFSDRSKLLYHDYEVVELMMKYKYAVGLLTLSSTFGNGESIKPIAVDSIQPSPENLMKGRYKMSCEYALIYKEKRLNDLGKKFIDYVFSDSAREIIAQYGMIPLNRK